jgi:autotransporter-associated beta strand protein
MHLLAAGALCAAAAPAFSQTAVTTPGAFAALLNDPTVDELEITGGDLDLTGFPPLVLFATDQILQGDIASRTISNADLTIQGPSVLAINPSAIWDGTITIEENGRLDLVAPTTLSAGASVDVEDLGELRIFGTGSTYDATFWGKVTGTTTSIVSFGADGTTTLEALPSFNADLNIVVYNSFQFAAAPAINPRVVLGATLSGSHDVRIDVGTLDLNDFDFTIDSLTGAEGTSIDLGSGTLSAGDNESTTFAGVISGTGNLIKTGTGNLTLTGVNTYTGTTTVNGGTLTFEADQTGTTAIIVQSGGTLAVDFAQTGTPTYTIENGGTANINADIADATAVTIDTGGVVNLNLRPTQTIGSLAGGGTLNLNMTDLTVGDATDTTFSGVVTGMGGITKVGAGNLALSGVNTFAGALTINEGTITLDGDLANTAAVVVATGATLDLNDNDETIGSLTGGGSVTLGSATLTVGDASAFPFDGVISETGGLTKAGAGTMTLSAAQTYTGATTVAAGQLIALGDLATSGVTVNSGASFNLEGAMTDANADVTVDAGATLFGDGSIGDNLTNNGTVTFVGQGAGDTLNVGGDYTQGSTGTLNIQLGAAGGLVIAGTANLDGTLNVQTPVDPANFDITQTFDVVDASSTSGNFATVTDDFIFLDLSTANVGGNVQISVARNATTFASIANTTNQQAVAAVLDSVGAPADELEDAVNRIVASSEAAALATYDQLAGGAAATASTQIAAAPSQLNNRMLDEIVGILPATNRPLGAFGQAPGVNAFDEVDHITLFSFYQGSTAEEAEAESKPTIAGLSPTPWASVFGGIGEQGDGAEGIEYNRYGLIAGLDLEAEETLARYGVALAVEQSDFEFARDNGEVDITSFYVSAYARQPLVNDWTFSVTGSLGLHSHELSRNILIGVTPTTASADYDSQSLAIAGEISRAFEFTRTNEDPGSHPTVTTIEPFARLTYSISDQDGYSESGAGTAGLVVDDEEFDSIRAAVGVRVQHQYMFANAIEATLQGRALVNFAIDNSDSSLNVSFVNTPGSNFAIEGTDQDDIFGQIGAGLALEINQNWDFHIDLDLQLSDEATAAVLAAGLRYEF